MYEAVIFDLDGTLADSVDLHVEAWRKAMKEIWREPTEEEVRKYRENVGKSLRDIMRAIYGEIDEKVFKGVKERKVRYFREMLHLLRPRIPREILLELKRRYRLGVFTSTNRETARDMLRALGMDGIFEVVVTADDVREAKPDPAGIFEVMRRMGVRKVLYVGDTEYDRIAAERAGVDYMNVEEFVRAWKSLL